MPTPLRVILENHALLRDPQGLPGLVLRPGPIIPQFRPFLETLNAEIAELPIMTFLAAREAGVPISLLPAAVLYGGQHRFLWRHRDRPVSAQCLAGKRIAIRSFSVTTAAWIRDILQEEHGVDPASIQWAECEPAHVAGFSPPEHVDQSYHGTSPEALLRAGEVDAAVLRRPQPDDPFVQLIPNADAASGAWEARQGAVQLNHIICTRRAFVQDRLHCVEDFLSRLIPPAITARAELAPSLHRALACALRQGVIREPMSVEQLYL